MAKVSKAFLAKYPGKCPKCNHRYSIGKDWLNFVDNVLQHVKCPADGQSALGTTVKTANNYQSTGARINDPQPIVEDVSDAIADAIAESLTEIEREAPQVKSFIPSKYQMAIFDAITALVNRVADFRHLVIEAVAGSGKTTTIEQALKLIPEEFLVAFVAFNTHIAAELAKRCQRMELNNVMASTLHSLGKTNLLQYFPNIKLEKDKVGRLMDNIYPVVKETIESMIEKGELEVKDDVIEDISVSDFIKLYTKRNRSKRMMMRRLVAICKNTLIDPFKRDDVLSAIDKYGLEIDLVYRDELIERLPVILDRCKNDTKTMDFDDMLWMPVALNLSLKKFDFLMVDEFQDMNKCQIAFIMRSIKEDGHIIAVGDRYQSLYGFRGADTDAIPNAIITLNAKVLPLSVTYRCPVSHVKLAQEIVPEIEPREGAPEGTVIELDYFALAGYLKDGDMVICRTNAPLVKPAFECIRAGKKATIRGLEVGESLINLIKRFETNNLREFLISLQEYYEVEVEKLISWGKEMQALLLTDRCETLLSIAAECQDVAQLSKRIDTLFSNDEEGGIIFSSVHRAKGLEAETVYILKPELLPHPKAVQAWEKDQEMNCKYVALTRSKNTLIFVKGGDKS